MSAPNLGPCDTDIEASQQYGPGKELLIDVDTEARLIGQLETALLEVVTRHSQAGDGGLVPFYVLKFRTAPARCPDT